jgi:hypothetical protein
MKWKLLLTLAIGFASMPLAAGPSRAEELLTRKDGTQYLGVLHKDKEGHKTFVTCSGTSLTIAVDDKIEATDELCEKISLPGLDTQINMEPPPVP